MPKSSSRGSEIREEFILLLCVNVSGWIEGVEERRLWVWAERNGGGFLCSLLAICRDEGQLQ